MSIFTIAALMLATIPAASAQNQTTFRDANGQTTGTATTYGNTTTFRDGRGQTTGTATREQRHYDVPQQPRPANWDRHSAAPLVQDHLLTLLIFAIRHRWLPPQCKTSVRLCSRRAE